MISHRNVISNTTAITLHESGFREALKPPGQKSQYMEVALGLLPQSHIYALVVVCHVGPYRGDQVVILPKFDLGAYLNAIQTFRIVSLFLVRFVIQERSTFPSSLWLNLANFRFHPSSSPC